MYLTFFSSIYEPGESIFNLLFQLGIHAELLLKAGGTRRMQVKIEESIKNVRRLVMLNSMCQLDWAR
jgi:hypothetical protein